MVPEIKLSLFKRIKDTVLHIDSNPAHIKQVLHYRGCPQTEPLEVMCDDKEPFPHFTPLIGLRGGVMKRCQRCGAKKEFFD